MLVMQRDPAAYPFRPKVKTAADHTLKRSQVTKLRIPEYPPTHSDNMRPPIPGHPPTCDALP